MLGDCDCAGNEEVSVLKPHDELAYGGGVGLMLSAHVGHHMPAVLYDSAKTVLVVLGKPMPE
jgi:hypothetical protein